MAKKVYAALVHCMITRPAVMKLTKEALDKWKSLVLYISYLVTPNPHPVTTLVCLVWKSSQKFKGLSMNYLLIKGSGMLNPVRVVFLRFRKGVSVALGDIKKVQHSVAR